MKDQNQYDTYAPYMIKCSSEQNKEKTTCETCVYKYDLYMNGGRFICIRKGTPFTSKSITYTTFCDKWEGKE